MQSPSKSRGRWRSFVRGGGVAALALALAAWLYMAEGAWTARYWQSQLEAAPDDELRSLAARIAASGDAGLDALVACLGSSKESVRREVRLALDDELDRWARLPNREASDRLGRLAAALAETKNLDSASSWFAADLATRILLWPTDGGIVDRSRLVAHCEQVLRASHAPRDGEGPDRWRRADDVARSEKAAAARRISSMPLATGAPPPESLQAPGLPPMLAGLQETGEPPNVAAVAEPRRLGPGAAAQSRPVAAAKKPTDRNPLRAAANQPAQTVDDQAEQAAWSDPLEGAADAAAASGDSGRWKKTAMGELFAELGSGSAQASAAAGAELARRGFSRREIEVGKHLTSTDAEERRRWTEALPGMRGIDAKGWLLLLSRDDNPGVRRAAMTLMATSQDPQMLGRVEELARNDADLALREQAARILEDNSKTSFTR
jgi:hypothetical protein